MRSRAVRAMAAVLAGRMAARLSPEQAQAVLAIAKPKPSAAQQEAKQAKEAEKQQSAKVQLSQAIRELSPEQVVSIPQPVAEAILAVLGIGPSPGSSPQGPASSAPAASVSESATHSIA